MLTLDTLSPSFSTLHTPVLDSVMIFFTRIGDLGLIWGLITITLLLSTRYRAIGYRMVGGLGIALILGEGILKHLIDRPRPFETFSEIVLLIPPPLTSSFPSGHTSASIVSALILSYYFSSRSRLFVILIWIIALAVTISRLYLQVHYPTDVLGGIVVGAVSAGLSIVLLHRFLPQKNPLMKTES